MIPIQPGKGWRTGRYSIVASSASAKAEWDAFVQKLPKAMRAAYERLAEHPLEARGTRQFPLKGKRNKPFWEYEVTAGDRLYYAVDLRLRVVVVAVLPHAARSESMVGRVLSRRDAFDTTVSEQQAKAEPPPVEPALAPRRPRKSK